MADTLKLPKGAADWRPMTEEEIDAAAEITPEVIADAAEWARSVDPLLGALLDAKPMETDG